MIPPADHPRCTALVGRIQRCPAYQGRRHTRCWHLPVPHLYRKERICQRTSRRASSIIRRQEESSRILSRLATLLIRRTRKKTRPRSSSAGSSAKTPPRKIIWQVVSPDARKRLRTAFGELARATLALLFAYIARLFLGLAYKKITDARGEVGRAERGVLALQRLLGCFYIRRIVGRCRLLRALGSTRRSDDEGNRIQTLKLAERRYRIGEGFASGAAEGDAPLVRVIVGVRVVGRSEPVWCIRRFVANGTGGWTPVYSGCEAQAESIMLDFYVSVFTKLEIHARQEKDAAKTAAAVAPATTSGRK